MGTLFVQVKSGQEMNLDVLTLFMISPLQLLFCKYFRSECSAYLRKSLFTCSLWSHHNAPSHFFTGHQWAGGHQEVQRQWRWVRKRAKRREGRRKSRTAVMFLSYLFSFRRKWGGQGDDASGAEDAPDTEAGQHRRAEGGFSQEGETLPCLWICGEGQREHNIIINSTEF